MIPLIELTEDEWFDTYKPIKNHIDKNASVDGHMFETYGEELEFIEKQKELYIWTYGDGDDGGTYIWNGFHVVNRIGYFLTEVPFDDKSITQVMIWNPEWDEIVDVNLEEELDN
jgi:hypothetical protein